MYKRKAICARMAGASAGKPRGGGYGGRALDQARSGASSESARIVIPVESQEVRKKLRSRRESGGRRRRVARAGAQPVSTYASACARPTEAMARAPCSNTRHVHMRMRTHAHAQAHAQAHAPAHAQPQAHAAHTHAYAQVRVRVCVHVRVRVHQSTHGACIWRGPFLRICA